MLRGIKLQASPTASQREVLSQWMGCARYIWNAKTRQEKAERHHLRSKETGEYPPLDSSYSHFKSKEETPWLFDCPSVVLRNSIANWYRTYQDFFKKRCQRPRSKKKDGRGSVYLTRELFSFQKGEDGVTRLFIGSKRNNIGFLTIKVHRAFREPKSLYIKKRHQKYWVSFCYEDGKPQEQLPTAREHLKGLATKGEEYLMQHVVGVDRGVARPVQCSNQEEAFDLTAGEKKKKQYHERRRLFYQKKLSRQTKGSKRRYVTKVRLSRKHAKVVNIRDNFCHQVSRKLVNAPLTRVLIFEDLGTKGMTRRPKPKKDAMGKFLPNKARAKAGLNRHILDKNWYKLEVYTQYKSHQAGKAFFKVAPNHTSQECAHCHHIHPDNRRSQARFQCRSCGHTDNADFNAAKVIRWRAIQYITNSGTELSSRGVLSLADMGRGADVRQRGALGQPGAGG